MKLSDRLVALLKRAVDLGREMAVERRIGFPYDADDLDKELPEYLEALKDLVEVFDCHSNLVTTSVMVNAVSFPGITCSEEQYQLEATSHGDNVTVDLKLLEARLGFEFVEYDDFSIHYVYTYDDKGKHYPLVDDVRKEYVFRFLNSVELYVPDSRYFLESLKELPPEPQPETLGAALRAGLARLNSEKSEEAYKNLLELYKANKDAQAEEVDWVHRRLLLFKEQRS